MPVLYTVLIILSVSAVAVADIFLRKTQELTPFYKAFTSPWMLGAILLYLFQIFFFTYLFEVGAKLSYVGVLQTALYATIVLLGSVFVFGETFTSLQIFGMALAISGAIILSL